MASLRHPTVKTSTKARHTVSRRGDTTVGALVLLAVTLAIGFFIWGFSLGWMGISFNDLSNNLNRAVLQVKTSAQLSFEAINYTSSGRSAMLRNVADVPVTLTRVEIVTPEGYLRAYYPSAGFANLSKLMPKQNTTLTDREIPLCGVCVGGERLKLRVWYVATDLFDEANPVFSADEMKFVETIFIYPGGPTLPTCQIPEGSKWLFIDLVDPITFTDSGRIPNPPSNRLFVRAPFASHSENVLLNVVVVNASGAVGGASGTVPSIGNSIVELSGPIGGFVVPLNITVEASGFEVVQRFWKLGGIPYKAHASGVQLWWSVDTATNERLLNVVMVELGVNDLVGGNFVITLTLKDCMGNTVYTSYNTVNMPRGIFRDSVFFDVSPPVRMDDVYEIIVEVNEA